MSNDHKRQFDEMQDKVTNELVYVIEVNKERSFYLHTATGAGKTYLSSQSEKENFWKQNSKISKPSLNKPHQS